MINVKIDVTKLDVSGYVSKAIDTGLIQATNLVHKDAKKNCPADTTLLFNSLSKDYDFEKKEGIVFSNVKYAPFVEFADGSVFAKKKARKRGKIPFLRPALYDNEKEIVNLIANGIDKELK